MLTSSSSDEISDSFESWDREWKPTQQQQQQQKTKPCNNSVQNSNPTQLKTNKQLLCKIPVPISQHTQKLKKEKNGKWKTCTDTYEEKI